jgi:hypothetical protein
MLRQLDRIPPVQKARTAVFIPQSFAGILASSGLRLIAVRSFPDCPALSSLALIDGMPPVTAT